MSIPERFRQDTCANYKEKCYSCRANSDINNHYPWYRNKNLVEVVRCVECKHKQDIVGRSVRACELHKTLVYDDDFCSYGERKDGAGK